MRGATAAMGVRSVIRSLFLASLALPCQAQAPLGQEFVLGSGIDPQVTALPDGFVAIWRHNVDGVRARRFDARGVPVGAEIVVSASTDDAPIGRPTLDATPDGGFVVVYQSRRPPSTVADDVFVRRFDAAGAEIGSELMVNETTTGVQWMPAVAVGADGAFMVAWRSPGDDNEVYARRFDAGGVPLAGEFRVNTTHTPASAMVDVGVQAAPDGGFLATWSAYSVAGSFDAFARRFDANGQPLGAEFTVNTFTGFDQVQPAAAFDGSGNFVVVWAGVGAAGDSYSGIFGQLFQADGSRRGAEFRVNRTVFGNQFGPHVAAEADGRFLVAWNSIRVPGSDTDVHAQLLGPQGQRLAREFTVNSTVNAYFADPSVATDAHGHMMIVWEGADEHSPASLEPHGLALGGLRVTALAVDAAGNGVAEPGEVVSVAPTWLNTLGTAVGVTGTGGPFTGPAGGTYTITDGAASYGTLADRAEASCGGDCFAVMATASARPALHWDTTLAETLSTGHRAAHIIHLGDSFTDVPRASLYYRFVETLLHYGVTAGCQADAYCPSAATSRQQMAVFLLVAQDGDTYRPLACASAPFPDVPADSPFCPWVQQLAIRGITGGCGSGNFCPTAPVSREQMAVFTLKTLDPALVPPACAPPNTFNDVPEGSPFCPWIEELARRGVVAGCGGGAYCPAVPVTREQMAVFIAATFGLQLYGP